ncbi:hypothetical protein RM02_004061 [Salmonella enterica subsp. enterica]|uniref:IstB-like ATP-binding protein domain-containing protein n=2 Tax=Salmonella enterica TaxID=28901 RepID=A0A760GQC0_SALER|nr:hypothetical protein [Salmonella enterica subsp. enterica serovar Bispebjerg]EAA5301459.1 hypothetical protein [Salmonella enterica subsp. enterica serovar Manhattan]EAB5927712.1 hypothetical protein [Salmonella enterica subsp. enterica serovar Newport]EBX1108224.1 hypothetical protein [Salmonella enterica subsp. enterica serovar Salford]ECE6512150.1 hypothetical protein [Salmonella enterica subsp. enterica]ECM3601156.1 hypothetical protein [Salmonella enterica subsp. enterica serovar Senft
MSNIHLLERSLCKLRLTRISAEWYTLEKRALAEGWTLSRYLLTLCNEELLWRESEKLRRYKKEARLPVAKTSCCSVPAGWGGIFEDPDETMVVVAADRLIHQGYMFKLKGESYRKKTAKAA